VPENSFKLIYKLGQVNNSVDYVTWVRSSSLICTSMGLMRIHWPSLLRFDWITSLIKLERITADGDDDDDYANDVV